MDLLDHVTTCIKITSVLMRILIFCKLLILGHSKEHMNIISTIQRVFNDPREQSFELILYTNDIVWGIGLGCVNENIAQGRSYDQNNIDISDCFFTRSSYYSGKGGVIYVYANSYSVNIISSMFYYCFASIGGAIYSLSSNSYLRMICANMCSSDNSYDKHFASFDVFQSNQVEYLSVSKCSHTTSGKISMFFGQGIHRVDNTNSSMNNAYQTSAIRIESSSSFTSSHCTFSNNKASTNICISFYSTSGIISISYANIVHNNSPSGEGVVYVGGAASKKMLYCIFQNNQNYLFSVYSGSLEVSHSFIYHSGSFSTRTAVSTSNNNSLTNRNTYQLQFFNSHYCNTDIPPPPRTLDQTPMKSLEETISMTNEETPRITLDQTVEQTIRESPTETIPRTYSELICTNQMGNKREISVIFSSLYLSYIQ